MEAQTVAFFRLKALSHEWTPLPEPDFGETIFSVSPFLNPVEPLHQPSLPVLPNPLKKPRLDTYDPPRSCPAEPEDNMVDLDELIHPGTDPPGNNTPFPDRLRSSMAFWESINPPHYIMESLRDGVDIGLIPDIENHLPPEGINPPPEYALHHQGSGNGPMGQDSRTG